MEQQQNLKMFVQINSMELGDAKRVICDGCIIKLNDCILFKETVESSLQTLQVAAQGK